MYSPILVRRKRMKIFELAKELNVTPKDLIAFYRKNDYQVSSHMQNVTDDMFDFAKENMTDISDNESKTDNIETKDTSTTQIKPNVKTPAKTFKADDEIPCKSVTPWSLSAVGVDKNTVYHWEYFGDIEYVKYRDLQALRRTEYVTNPKILILDADLRNQWGRELGDAYKYFENIEYPEEYFDKSDDEFEELLQKAPHWLTNIIKVTAMAMIRAENYPSVKKIRIIDDTLGTCIKDFL